MSDDKEEESSKGLEAEVKVTEDEPTFTYDYDRTVESRGEYNERSRPQGQGEDLAGKLFLGGVSWQTTLEGLKYHFERIGELKDAALFTDKKTGQSKGFAFVTFKDPAAAEIALSQEHVIDGRSIDVKKAVARDMAPAPTRQLNTKIFVGGLSIETSDREFRDYFAQYGPVKDSIVMMDKTTNRSRGFGFVTFEREDTCTEVCNNKNHELGGKWIDVKRAEPLHSKNLEPGQPGPPGRGGGGGGAGGSYYGPGGAMTGMRPGGMYSGGGGGGGGGGGVYGPGSGAGMAQGAGMNMMQMRMAAMAAMMRQGAGGGMPQYPGGPTGGYGQYGAAPGMYGAGAYGGGYGGAQNSYSQYGTGGPGANPKADSNLRNGTDSSAPDGESNLNSGGGRPGAAYSPSDGDADKEKSIPTASNGADGSRNGPGAPPGPYGHPGGYGAYGNPSSYGAPPASYGSYGAPPAGYGVASAYGYGAGRGSYGGGYNQGGDRGGGGRYGGDYDRDRDRGDRDRDRGGSGRYGGGKYGGRDDRNYRPY